MIIQDRLSLPSHHPMDLFFLSRARHLAIAHFGGVDLPRSGLVPPWKHVIPDCCCLILSCKGHEFGGLQLCVAQTSFTRAS